MRRNAFQLLRPTLARMWCIEAEKMNIDELKQKLEELKVPKQAYSILGRKQDRLCIELRDSIWFVYFIERGEERILKQFINEADACDFMLLRLRYDIP